MDKQPVHLCNRTQTETSIHEYIEGINHCNTGEKRREVAASPVEVAAETGLYVDFEYENIPG